MKPNCCSLYKQFRCVFAEPRTFVGPRKRLMVLLPLAYKLGVMTTMLGGLLVLMLKGLTISVILLILAVGNLLSKHKYHGFPHHGPKDIHVHIHTDAHGQAYGTRGATDIPRRTPRPLPKEVASTASTTRLPSLPRLPLKNFSTARKIHRHTGYPLIVIRNGKVLEYHGIILTYRICGKSYYPYTY